MIVALVQLTSTRDIDRNIAASTTLAQQALEQGAKWILFPENAPFLGADRDKLSIAEPIEGQMVDAYKQIAREGQCWVTLGSFPEKSPSPDHTYNTQLLISPNGDITSIYRKIHLFDVELPNGDTLHESGSILPGDKLVTAPVTIDETTLTVGLSICYDLRFPELYRALTLQHGAQALTVPSAFTMPTGRAHWCALLRARAIENQAYVLAPNQYGHHAPKRESYGHSVIYDPWGQQLACAPDRECVITAEIDLSVLQDIRRRMPCQQHVHPFDYTLKP